MVLSLNAKQDNTHNVIIYVTSKGQLADLTGTKAAVSHAPRINHLGGYTKSGT